jgi:hypothetical protein
LCSDWSMNWSMGSTARTGPRTCSSFVPLRSGARQRERFCIA